MRDVILVLLSALLAATVADAAPPECDTLSGRARTTAERLLSSEHPYDCCDDTIARCLEARPTCVLATRLAADVCRRVATGQDEERIRRALSRRARSMVGGGAVAVVELAGAPVAGRPEAPVEVVVYACARCPYCSRLLPALHQAITAGPLLGQARLVLRLFPIRGHEGSTEAALAVLAGAKQGRGWEFLLYGYRHFDQFSVDRQAEWAAAVGLEPSAFTAALADPALRDALVGSKKEGLANGVEETPTLFLNRRRWMGDLELEQLVDAIAEEADRVRGVKWTELRASLSRCWECW
jgi:protein-disulfide isomerase